jgi:hypothetical protein
MPERYLTPSSISYLSLFLLTLIITVYLIVRAIRRGKKFSLRRDGALLASFASLTLLALLLMGDYALLPNDRLRPLFLEVVVIDLMLIALIQFAYDFPTPSGKYKIERGLVTLFSGYCLYHDVGDAVYRFNRLQQEGHVAFLGTQVFVMMGIQFALIIFIFARPAVRNWQQPALRNFALIMLLPVGLVVASFFRGTQPLVTFWYPIVFSVSLLFIVLFFVLNYLASQPEQTSFVIKISGAVLTSVLAVFGVIAWLVAQPYADRYVSPLQQLDPPHPPFQPGWRGGLCGQRATLPLGGKLRAGVGDESTEMGSGGFQFFAFRKILSAGLCLQLLRHRHEIQLLGALPIVSSQYFGAENFRSLNPGHFPAQHKLRKFPPVF